MAVLEQVCFNLCLICLRNGQEVENLMNRKREQVIKVRRQIQANIASLTREETRAYTQNNYVAKKYIRREINRLKKIREELI